MKTTDLIPIILYQLKDGDRYGYEIIKQIEDCSDGKIVIKQPTLYSVLKKLEQNKFITSYWQDSEIGGKRHYYKLTVNGLSQLSTYPALQQLITDALDEDVEPSISANSESISNFSTNAIAESDLASSILQSEESVEPVINPIKIDLTPPTGLASPTIDNLPVVNEVFTTFDETIDMPSDSSNIFDVIEPAVNIETSSNNINIFDMMEPTPAPSTFSIFEAIGAEDAVNSEPTVINEESLATPDTNLNVVNEIKLTTQQSPAIENIVSIEPEVEPVELKSKLTDKLDTSAEAFITSDDLVNNEMPDQEENYSPVEQIKYLNYIDLSTDENACSSRKVVSKHLQKMAYTCSTLLIMFILTLAICSKYSFGKVYYIAAIASVLSIILYPILLLRDISKLRFKYCTNPFKYSLIQDIFIKVSTFASLVIATFAYNITITLSFADIFKISNFANFYAPIIFASIFLFDLIFGMLLYKNYRTKK